MNSKRRVIIGIICAVLAAVCTFVYAASVRGEASAQREESLARYGGEQVEVCVATRDILPGETISRDNTTTSLWISSLLPKDSVTTLEDIEGVTVEQAVLANEPISRARLEGAQASIDVPEGLCAVSVPAEDVRAVGGAIEPGSLLDVYANTDAGSILLGHNLLVLATSSSSGSQSGSTARSLAWITLAVTPDSVQELLDVSADDELFFVLPGQADATKEVSDGNVG